MIESVNGISSVTPSVPTEKKSVGEVRDEFSRVLTEALQRVNDQQIEAEQLEMQLAAGNVDSLHDVTIATEKAYLGLQLTVQIRNKVVEAYQEMMRMQI